MEETSEFYAQKQKQPFDKMNLPERRLGKLNVNTWWQIFLYESTDEGRTDGDSF